MNDLPMSSVEQRALKLLAKEVGMPVAMVTRYCPPLELGVVLRAIAAALRQQEQLAEPLREQPEARGGVDDVTRDAARWRKLVANTKTDHIWHFVLSEEHKEGHDHFLDVIDALPLTAAQQPVQEGGRARLTNPWTGEPRDYRDLNSDPAGTLCVEPGAPLKAAPPSAPVGVEVSDEFESWLAAHYLLVSELDRNIARAAWDAALAQQPAQAAPGANTEFARIGDMSPTVALRVGTDSDCDVYLSVTGDPGEGVEFCTSGPGGGKSPRTREALVALMDAIRQDNIEDPRRDWWARRNIPTPPGDDAAGGGHG